MTLNRILMALMQSLLALLLIAGDAEAEPCMIMEEQGWTSADSPDPASVSSDRDDRLVLAANRSSDPDDDDHGFGHLLPSPDAAFVIDEARLIACGRSAYPTAPPSHRPCAAPSTGPPSV